MMANIKKFDDFDTLNENDKDRDIFSHKLDLVQDENHEPDRYISDDGWNGQTLEEIGLMEWIEKVYAVGYELKNGRRGSYAISGDTGEDLKRQIEDLREELDGIIEDM